VSQPPLSAQVAGVEEALGVQIFERGRLVRVSAAVAMIVERSRTMLREAGDLVDAARQQADPLRGTARIGVVATVCPSLLPEIGRPLTRALSTLHVVWSEDKTAPLLEQLDEARLDAAIVAKDARVAHLPHAPLGEDPFVIAGPRDHPLMKPRLASLLGHRRVRLPLVQQRAALSGREVADAAHLVADRAAHVADLLLVAAHVVAEHRARPHVSSLGGQTRNPYDLTRTPGGSSGGTGAALAANFAVLGTGSDTGQSVRSPSSANSLVGLRPTRGLVSRAGMIPFSTTQDEAGPMARTVEDVARMLDAIAGYHPADPITAFSQGHVPASYTAALSASGLKGARIGLLTDMMGRDPIHHDVNQVVERAVARIVAMGATVVRVTIPGLEDLTRGLSLMAFEFKTAFDAYLAGLGAAAPVKSLAEFVARGEFHESMRRGLEADLKVVDGPGSPEHQRMVARRNVLRQAIMTVMAANRLDAILYPHQKRLVVPIGEDQAERNGVLSNSTGFPALTFPGGFSPPTASAPIGVPVGLELLGPEWSEPVLFRLAFAFEQAARPRKPPASTPLLK
jgi:Asp-tRNA(Asn)/Glu-tRNA(Gln) amidotransferase A subunit family amidase